MYIHTHIYTYAQLYIYRLTTFIHATYTGSLTLQCAVKSSEGANWLQMCGIWKKL